MLSTEYHKNSNVCDASEIADYLYFRYISKVHKHSLNLTLTSLQLLPMKLFFCFSYFPSFSDSDVLV